MESMYKELEEMRSAMEAVTAECRAKSALSDRLKQAHDEQILKLQEAKAVIERQAKGMDAKDEEISVAKQVNEELGSKFAEKEAALKHLSFAHESLRTSFGEKVKKLDGENKQLIAALDVASEKGEEQERVICDYMREIEKLKGLLSMSQMKCADAEKRAVAAKEVKRREDMIVKLEHEKGEVENQLKWKIEQFTHLEEAHDKIQEKFRISRKEWEMEKASLIEKVSSLQTSLDSQTRIVGDLQSQLHMCNQALSREESRRKMAEMQVSESKALYENVMAEYGDVRMNINTMAAKRDEEIADLRNSLSTKSTLVKELGFRTTHLEQENEELHSSLRALHEAEIDGVDAIASFKTLRQKYKALEQTHRGCIESLKAREVEWGREMKKLSEELEECLLNLSNKDEHVQHLQVEVEGCHSLVMLQKLENEEMSAVLMIVKSKFFELCTILEDFKLESEQYFAEAKERVCLLVEQLEIKNRSLVEAQAEVVRERETVDSLLRSSEYSESIKQENLMMKKEVDSYKGMLEESSRNFQHLKDQTACKDSELLEDMRKAIAALDQANLDLDERSSQLNMVEFELEQSKLVVERIENLKLELEVELNKRCEENHMIRKDLEDSLFAKMEAEKDLEEGKRSFRQTLEDKDQKIEELQRLLALLEEDKCKLVASYLAISESEKSTENKNIRLVQFVEDTDKKLRSFQKEVDLLEQNYIRGEIASLVELEEEKLLSLEIADEKDEVMRSIRQTSEDKDQKIEELQRHLALLEADKHKLEASLLAQLESEKLSENRNEQLVQVAEDSNEKLRSIQKEVDLLEQHYILRMIVSAVELEEEKLRSLEITEEKDEVIDNMKQLILSYEQVVVQFIEGNEARILDEQAIHFRNMLIVELEEEIGALRLKTEFEEKLSASLKNQIKELEAKFSAVLSEKENQKVHFENELKFLRSKETALEVRTEVLINQMMEVGGLVDSISVRGEEMKRQLNKVEQLATNDSPRVATNGKLDDRNFQSPTNYKAEQVSGRRSPLKEYNC